MVGLCMVSCRKCTEFWLVIVIAENRFKQQCGLSANVVRDLTPIPSRGSKRVFASKWFSDARQALRGSYFVKVSSPRSMANNDRDVSLVENFHSHTEYIQQNNCVVDVYIRNQQHRSACSLPELCLDDELYPKLHTVHAMHLHHLHIRSMFAGTTRDLHVLHNLTWTPSTGDSDPTAEK